MYTLILFIHILTGTISLLFAANAIRLVRSKTVMSEITKMWVAYASTLLSGVFLLTMSPSIAGHLCLTASIFIAVLSGVHGYAFYTQQQSS